MNKVWIEIEKGADKAINHERAEKFSELLAKLGSPSEVWYNENERVQKYCLTVDGAGGFVELNDSGHWFNLDNLSV